MDCSEGYLEIMRGQSQCQSHQRFEAMDLLFCFGEGYFSDDDNSTDSITEIKDGLPFFLAALGVF